MAFPQVAAGWSVFFLNLGHDVYLLSDAPGSRSNQHGAYIYICILVGSSFWFDRINLG